MNFIKQELQKSQDLLGKMLSSETLLNTIQSIAQLCTQAIEKGGKILFAGNGGSAADCQHLAAELICRLSYDRPAMPALALTTDTSALTAIGNDYAYEYLFARQIEGLGNKGDVLIGISTSGKSPNILKALSAAKNKGMHCIGFTGQIAPLMSEVCDLVLNIPSTETPKIQEAHIACGHIICALIEDALFGAKYNPLNKAVSLEA